MRKPQKKAPKAFVNVITVVPGPLMRPAPDAGSSPDHYETLRDTVEGTLKNDDLLAEFRFPEGITVTDQIAMLQAAAADLQLAQQPVAFDEAKRKQESSEFRFVVEDVANKLRFAEAVALTVVDALGTAVHTDQMLITLRRGANELTEAIGTLDHAVENAKLVGTRLVVPPKP